VDVECEEHEYEEEEVELHFGGMAFLVIVAGAYSS
jgi:hypothetical protein